VQDHDELVQLERNLPISVQEYQNAKAFDEIYDILVNHQKMVAEQGVIAPSTQTLNLIKFYGETGLRKFFLKSMKQLFEDKEQQAVEKMMCLLPFLPLRLQIIFFDKLTVFLSESVTNVQYVENNQLIERCIDYLALCGELEASFEVIHRLSFVIGSLGSYSVNADQLVALLRLIASPDEGFSTESTFKSSITAQGHKFALQKDISAMVLGILGRMNQTSYPSAFFNFAGINSGIALFNPEQNFSMPQHGFTFCTWFRFESSSNSYYTRIFSLFDKKQEGIELLLKGNQLSVHLVCNGKKYNIPFDNHYIPSHRWSFIALTRIKHTMPFFSKSELCLQVNEKQYKTEVKKFPALSSGIEFFHFGTDKLHRSGLVVQPFKGQIGPIAIFQTNLADAEVKNIMDLGMDFQYQLKKCELDQFQAGSGTTVQLTNGEALFKSLILLYIPRACTAGNSTLVDNSPKCAAHARLMASVYVTKHISDTLSCIGGIEVLFPLFLSLGSNDWSVEEGLCGRLLALIYKCLQKSESNQRDAVRKNSFGTLGFLLTKIDPAHLNDYTVSEFKALTTSFSPEQEIYGSLCVNILFNFNIWQHAEFRVQNKLLVFLREQVEKHPDFFYDLIGVQQMLDVARKYFAFSPPIKNETGVTPVYDLSSYSPEKTGDSRLSDEEVFCLRSLYFDLIKMLLVRADKVTDNDIRALFTYIIDCKDKKQTHCTLKWILQLVDEEVPHIQNLMVDIWLPTMFKCLTDQYSELRILYLKLLGRLLEHTPKEKRKKYSEQGYFHLMGVYLQEIDAYTYCSLMEVLTLHTSSMVSKNSRFSTKNHMIAIGGLLDALLILMPKQDTTIVSRFIKDLHSLAQNKKNASVILRIPFWHNKILQLCTSTESIPNGCLQLISTILSKNFDNRGTFQELLDSLSYIKILSVERKTVSEHKTLIYFFEQMTPQISEFMRSDNVKMSKDCPFWENLFYFCQHVEELVLYDTNQSLKERVDLSCAIMTMTDFIIKKSIKNKSIMEILHCQFGKKKGFSFRSILDVAQEVTGMSQKYVALMEPTLFVILFRLQLFLLEHLDQERITRENHTIRILALCCMDIELEQVPEPPFTQTEVGIDQETAHQRMYYIIAQLFTRIDNGQHNLISVVKPVLIKYREYLSTALTLIEARQFLSESTKFAYLNKRSDIEQFKRAYRTEWDCVKASQPLSQALEEIKGEYDQLVRSYQEKNNKLYQQALKDSSEEHSKMDARVHTIIKEISEEYNSNLWQEKHRYESWAHSVRRSIILTENSWKETERDFLFGVGVWKLTKVLPFQILDPTETAFDRRRPRIVLNPEGTRHLESSNTYNDDLPDEKEQLPETPLTADGSELASIMNFKFMDEEEKQDTLVENDKLSDTSSHHSIDDDDTPAEDDGFVLVSKAETSLSMIREQQEQTIETFEVELILPLQAIRGRLELTNSNLFFSIDAEYEDNPPKSEWNDYEKRWSVDSVEKIYRRRYLLSHTAIELFLIDRTTVYLNFIAPKANAKCVSQILKLHPPHLVLNAFPYSPQQLFKRSSMTEKWRRREISNFQYLMHLNTLANRTFNDLTQYFVMPWVLKDYVSTNIDLNDPNVFRDLSKPIGALNPVRLKDVIERFESFSDPYIPSFHYGSHYSSCGTVLYYMVRVEPFTEQNIKLQGGHFDLADRLFHSIPTTWQVIQESTSDVKELIPEFFYFAPMFKNTNTLKLGKRQDGIELSDVILPPWASSADDFVRIQKEALESEYVSQHLHKWIDLIFGYKQRGPEALKAYNLFYYLTYEGAIDLSKVEDPMVKKSIITQLQNFGQTPSQLLTKPHPERASKSAFQRPSYWPESSLTFNPFFSVRMGDESISIVHVKYLSAGRFLAINERRNLQLYQTMKTKPIMIMASPVGSAYSRDVILHSQMFACLQGWVVSCGHYDKSIKCTSLNDKKELKQSLYDHKDVVTCLAVCEKELSIVSGSIDCTVRVWKVDSRASSSPLSMRHILYGHDDAIHSVDVNYNLDLVVSASRNGKCILHRLYNGKFIRQIDHPQKSPIHIVRIAKAGYILLYSRKDKMIFCHTQNGTLISKANLDDEIRDICIASSSKFFFTGGQKGQLIVRNLHDMTEIKRYTILESPITCIQLRKISDGLEVTVGCANQQIYFFAFHEDESK